MQEFKFKNYNGKTIRKNKLLLNEIRLLMDLRDMNEDSIYQYIEDDSQILFMYKNFALAGFSWITVCEELNIAELSWFVTNNGVINALEGKKLLDYTLKYCSEHNINELKFNCYDKSWGRIKYKKKLFEKYGYTTTGDEDYDISLDTNNQNLTI